MTTFTGNVLKVLRGTAVAQLIGFLALPVISRLFSPEAFGALQAMQSILTLLLVASALRLEIAIMSVTEVELPSLLTCCLWLCLASSGIVLLAVTTWSFLFPIGETKLGALVYVLPLSLLMAGWGQVFSYVALRFKSFDLSANSKITQAVSFSGAALGAGVVLPSAIGLALADLAGRVLYCIALLRGSMDVLASVSLRVPMAIVASLWAAHRKLTLVALPGALINVLGSSYTPFMLLIIFSASDAGQYALVERVIGAPIGMIVGAVSQVFIASFAEAGRDARDSQLIVFRRLVFNQLRWGIVPAALFFLLAPTIFPIVFGSGWSTAGLYAQALAPLFLISFIVGPVNMALTLAGYQLLQFAWDLGRLVVISLTWLVIFIGKLPTVSALWLYCATAGLCYVGYLLIADIALNNSMKGRRDPSQHSNHKV